MYILSQIETNSNQILSCKSLSDSERYWDIFIDSNHLNKLKYLKPVLIPSSGYSHAQFKNLDFFNCVIPIPVFSERFKERMEDVLCDEMDFVHGEIVSAKVNVGIYIGLIKNVLQVFDEENSGKRFLSNGDVVPDSPYYYILPQSDFYIARDSKYPSKYVVSERFKELCDSNEFKLRFSNLPIYNMEWMNEITSKVEEALNDYVDFFKGQESTSKVLVSYNCRIPNVSGTTYLEILLKEDMLNETDIDLLTIEINYDIKDGVADIRSEFFGSDGVILNEFHHHADTTDIDGIEKSLVSFMETIMSEYDDILYKKFIKPRF